MEFKVKLYDKELDVRTTYAVFKDFDSLVCFVPSFCLMLHKKGYKCQYVEIVFDNFYITETFFINLSDFKANKTWTFNTMTNLQVFYYNLYLIEPNSEF